jgi:hypothetical protein
VKCRRCGAGPFATLVEVRAHHRDVHGLRSAIPARDESGRIAPTRVRVRERPRGRRIESVTGAPDPEPLPPATEPEPAPEPARGPSRPTVNAPTIHITPEARAQSVSDAVREAMPLPLLSDLIRTLSIAVSEADGAGEPGYLSPIQSTQVAVLLYDSTVDLVVTRFKGDVSRFKAGLAVVVILAAKGRVHGSAIRARIRERQAAREADAIIAAAHENGRDDLTPIEAAMLMQRGVIRANEEGVN